MAEVKQGQIRRWFSNSWVPDWERGKLFWVLGPTGHNPSNADPGWRYMQEDGGLDWHWASIIEPRSEVVSE